MDPERWRRVQVLFDGALVLPPEARAAYLEAETWGEPDVRAEVDRLLALDGSLEETPDVSADDPIRHLEVVRRRMPDRIGPYRILDVLGEGGVGTVYLAEQESPIRRLVALKLVRLGMESRGVIARFAVERQALARMNHPGIAQIFHVGETEQGRPYFVMEYIDGEAITRYCDDERLGIEERLELFAVVCRAVEHAHQRGIIHRDIKPSNVLVKERDGEPAPVVIDFGLAKAIEEGAEGSALTLQGQLVGTPTYMSPEQIVTAPEGLDARTDVYSLGVLLYELIVGVPPFTRSRHESLPAFLNRVREERFPPPGLRFRRESAEGEELARRRGTSVAGMRRWLRGGLERIMAKAVEKDRDGRYSSAAELAGDVARYLRGEPILASPPGPVHHLQHFVGRHRWSVGVFVTLLVAWFAASAASTLWYLLANRHRDEKAAIVRACDSVQLRIADAHLWFEEALAMDETVRVERDVDRPIREAIELVRATLVGGEAEGFGRLEPVGQEDARTALGLMLAELERFEDVTRERWLARDEEGETGGRLDQAYDATYRRILGHSSTASAAIESAMTREWQRAVRLAVAVNLVAMVLLAAPAAVMLRPGVRRRG